MLNSKLKLSCEESASEAIPANEKIQLLELALTLKENELKSCQLGIKILQDTLHKSMVIIHNFEDLFAAQQSKTIPSEEFVDDTIDQLLRENELLKSSNMLWLNRAISLELELVSTSKQANKDFLDATKKIKMLEDALSNCQCTKLSN